MLFDVKTSRIKLRKVKIIYILPLVIILCQLWSCSIFLKKTPQITNDVVIFPPPPSPTKIQFLTHFSNSDDIEGTQSSFKKFIFGEAVPKSIKRPFGLNLSYGKIYICDPGSGGLIILDLKENTYNLFTPGGRGLLKSPYNCFVDSDSTLYVTDHGRNQIIVFDKNGKYINSFGEKAPFMPNGIFVLDNKIWVSDTKKRKICVYSKETYELLYTFPDYEMGDDEYLYQPTSIYVNENKVFVNDFGAFQVKIFSHEGEFLESVGNYGKGFGQFARPKGIAVDRDTNLYVTDTGFENVQIFNEKGQLLMFFGGPYTGPGTMYMPSGITIDYDNLDYFKEYVDPGFNLKYIILVANQFGPEKISIYGRVEPKN